MKLKRIVSAFMAGVIAVTTTVSGLNLNVGAVSETIVIPSEKTNVVIPKSNTDMPEGYNTNLKGMMVGYVADLKDNDTIQLKPTVALRGELRSHIIINIFGETIDIGNDPFIQINESMKVKDIINLKGKTSFDNDGIKKEYQVSDITAIAIDLFDYVEGEDFDYIRFEMIISPGSSSDSDESAIISAPTTLKSTPVSPTSTKLTWKSTADSFNIYRATSKGGTYKKIGTSESASYTDKGLSKGKTYYYKVTAVSGGKESAFSKTISEKACAPAPTSVKATKSADGKAKLTWKKARGAEGYEIFMATSSGGKFSKIKTVTKGTTTGITKSGLTSGKTYYFKMRSYITVNGKKVYSGYSKTVKVTV